MRYQALLLPLALCACAGPQPEVHVYPDLRVTLVCADTLSISRVCRDKDGHAVSDAGQPVPRWQWSAPDADGLSHPAPQPPFGGCFKDGAIWAPWGRTCEIIAHEFCHWNDAVAGRLTLADREKCDRGFPG